MPTKYSPLTEYLRSVLEPDTVLELSVLAKLVGGLPPSSAKRVWWANTPGNTQAQAWLAAGRIARPDLSRGRVVFSVRGQPITRMRLPGAGRSGDVMNGVKALDDFIRQAGYESTVAAVARHTVFINPQTVSQAHGSAVFPVVRDMLHRGTVDTLPDGRRVLCDDNTTPTFAFLCAVSRTKGLDVQYNHVWSGSRDPDLYTALWNLCATPAFLAKTTDGQNHPEVRAALQYHAYELYGMHPKGQSAPQRPIGIDGLNWADMPDAVSDLEQAFRSRLASTPLSRPAIAAREIGWLFSDWKPDQSLAIAAGPDNTD